MKKIGFIGCGVMGEAILAGILKNNIVHSGSVYVSEAIAERSVVIEKKYSVNLLRNNDELIEKSDVVLLAIKPQDLANTLQGVSVAVDEKLFVSILAGKTIKSVRDIFPTQTSSLKVARIMPNTPALVSKGMFGITYSDNVSREEKNFVEQLFSSLGKCLVVEEDKMDIITAISGSGPAYVFAILEGLVTGAIQNGISEKDAKDIVMQTFEGSLALWRNDTEHSLAELRMRVTSKGGTTAAALEVLLGDENNIQKLLVRGVEAAKARSIELS